MGQPEGEQGVVLTRGLTRRYRGRAVVDGLDVVVPAGVVCGLVGPNGAGKTTTLRMLLGLVRPTAGTAWVLGSPIDRPGRYLPRVGALIEGPAFRTGLSGTDNLLVLARAGRLPASRIPQVLARVGLTADAGRSFRSYSLGMKQRLAIAAALLPDPDLLVLDEPLNGLDPAGICELRELIRGFAAEGGTALVSSHLLGELAHVAGHLVVLRAGRAVFAGPAAQLPDGHPPRVVLRTERPEDAVRLAEMAGGESGSGVAVDDLGQVVVELPAGLPEEAAYVRAGELNGRARDAGIVLTRVEVLRPSLEDVFFELTADPGRAGSGVADGEVA
jgi:ABC-2 type transport system ATP-binding protein